MTDQPDHRTPVALAQLSEEDQGLILAIDYEHRSYEEVAAQSGMEVADLKSRLSLARQRLRQKLGLTSTSAAA